jgi:hypothetical protein
VLASLARALQLAIDERDHLYRLAGKEPPGPKQIVATVTPGVRRLLDRFDDSAVAVFDAAWTLITCNRTWAALMGDPSARGPVSTATCSGGISPATPAASRAQPTRPSSISGRSSPTSKLRQADTHTIWRFAT